MIGWHHKHLCIRKRNHRWSYRKSEGDIVPFEGERQHNSTRGKVPYFVHATKELKIKEIAMRLVTPDNIRKLQRKLYLKAKQLNCDTLSKN